MRSRTLAQLTTVAVVGVVGALLLAPARASGGPTLYLHSAGGGYQQDLQAQRTGNPTSQDGITNNRAPAGSTLDDKAPTKDATAEARVLGQQTNNAITNPLWNFTFTGVVESLCLDIWVRAKTPPGSAAAPIKLKTQLIADSGTFVFEETTGGTADGTDQRITKLVKKTGTPPVNLAGASRLQIFSTTQEFPEYFVLYDSKTRASSITINPAECKAPAPPPSGSPSGSGTPSASASATPSGSATPSVSASPSPSVAEIVETSTHYTGATAGRYSEVLAARAEVTTGDGTAVPAGTVAFTLGEETVEAPVQGGVATAEVPIAVGSGEHVMTVRFTGGNGFAASAREVPVRVTALPTTCSVTRRLVSGKSALTATWRTAKGGLAGARVSFFYDNRGFTTVTADGNGVARATAGAGERGHVFTARSLTTRFYEGCSASVRV